MIKDFSSVARDMFDEGLTGAMGGDLSIKQGESIFITKKDAMLAHLADNDIVEVPLEPDKAKDEGASREIVVHRAIYKLTSAKAIVHAHSPATIALSLTENRIVPQDYDGISMMKGVPIIRVTEGAGPDDAARVIPSVIGSAPGIMAVKGHGAFAFAQSLNDAYRLVSILENSCKVLLSLRSNQPARKPETPHGPREPRRAIPPGIGVMDRSRSRFGRGKFDNR